MRRLFLSFALAATICRAVDAPPKIIERLVVVYSPADDVGGLNFSLSELRSGILAAAQQKGMEIVVINADEVAPGKNAPVRRQALLQDIEASVSDNKTSWLWISTHGVPKRMDGSDQMYNFQAGDERDTNLSLNGGDEIPYGEIAKTIDKYDSVRGIYLNACFGFCGRLEDQCRVGSGKCVISSAKRLEGTSYPRSDEVEKELVKAIQSPTPVDAHSLVAKFPLQSAAPSQQFLQFGPSAKPGIHDVHGNAVLTCHSFDNKEPRTFLPGRAYSPEQLLGKVDFGSSRKAIVDEPLAAFSYSYDFFCSPAGKWKVEAHKSFSGGAEECSGRQMNIEDCPNLTSYRKGASTDRHVLTAECAALKHAVEFADQKGMDLSEIRKDGFCFPSCGDTAPGECLAAGLGELCWPLGRHFVPTDKIPLPEISARSIDDFISAKACCVSVAKGGSARWDSATHSCQYVCADESGATVAEGTCFSPRLPGPLDNILSAGRGVPELPSPVKKSFVCEKTQSRSDKNCCEKAGGYFSPVALECYRTVKDVDPTTLKMEEEMRANPTHGR